jgi:hypothetical protein
LELNKAAVCTLCKELFEVLNWTYCFFEELEGIDGGLGV